MPKFELTAKSDWQRNGESVFKGQTMTIEISTPGVMPNNLFGNSRCADQLRHQFALHELNLPPDSPLLSAGKWDVKMVK